MTHDECVAKAMLLGMEYVPLANYSVGLLRKRVADGRFAGTALFSYFHADTMIPVSDCQNRSELDQPYTPEGLR